MPDKHPILIFNDIKFEQLKSLVAFIYNGSVNVSENNIHAFLNAAQSLLIKGLSEESKGEEKIMERRPSKNIENQEIKSNCRKNNAKLPVVRKPKIHFDGGKNFKKQRQLLPKPEGEHDMECEESLSKLQEISFTKYIHQNLNSKPGIRSDIIDNNKWNGPTDEKLKAPENYIVKSWKHNSMEDLNGRHKQTKPNAIKKIKLEKPVTTRVEEGDQADKNKVFPEQTNHPTGNHSERTKSEDLEDKIKKEVENTEQIMLVEPKQEIIEEDDINSEDYDSIHNSNSESIIPDSESIYDSRPVANYYRQTVVERAVPVPLLMCRTSLSEPDSVESNWMPQIGGPLPSDHPPQLNAVDNNPQDLQCRTCSQDLPCPTCTKKYKSRYALNRHILYECGKARKSFSCDECGKKVTRQDTLQKHKLIHLVQHLKKKESENDEEPPKPKKSC